MILQPGRCLRPRLCNVWPRARPRYQLYCVARAVAVRRHHDVDHRHAYLQLLLARQADERHCSRDKRGQEQERRQRRKILSTAIIAGLLFAVTDPAFAADAPKTKADCEKAKDMKWDDTKKVCVKK